MTIKVGDMVMYRQSEHDQFNPVPVDLVDGDVGKVVINRIGDGGPQIGVEFYTPIREAGYFGKKVPGVPEGVDARHYWLLTEAQLVNLDE